MKCPACGKELATGPCVPLPPIKLRIFEIIRRAGADGIDGPTLLTEYGLRIQPETLKAHIHQINQVIEPHGYRISDARKGRVGGRNGFGFYRLIKPREVAS